MTNTGLRAGRPGIASALAAALICGGGAAQAQAQAVEAEAPEAVEDGGFTNAPPPTSLTGYIDQSLWLDDSIFLPPPPPDESSVGIVDHGVFLETRVQEGSARWELAASDAALDPASMLNTFSCAVGAQLELERLPQTARLLTRAMRDIGPPIGAAKNRYDRTRPFVAMQGPVCTDATYLAGNGSYPSGHTAAGWIYALVLTQLAPDRASEILARGRVYGESRVVCGVHYPSDVEGGRLAATAVFGVLQSVPEYLEEMQQARLELHAVRADAAPPDAARCAVEEEAASGNAW